MPTDIRWDRDLQSDLLSTVRDSQTAMVEVVRSWTDVGQQFTRNLTPPVAGVDISSFVDGVFDFAEQTLAAQHQLALALVGVAARQADAAVEVVESTARESLRGVQDLVGAADEEDEEQEPRGRQDRKARKQDGKPDRRPFEERSLEELRDRARELDIEGRSAMSKDELIAALRDDRSK
jgi:Rho termination factor-like protein